MRCDHAGHPQIVDVRSGDDLKPQLAVLSQITAGVQGPADADVQAPRPVEQAFLRGPPERRAMGVSGAEVGVPGVEVSIEVDHGQRAVPGRQRPEHRQRDRVVAAEHQDERHPFQQVARPALDGADRLLDAVRVDREIPRVGHLLAGERRRLKGRVVGPQQPGRFPDVGGPEPGARPVADPAVKRHAEHGRIGVRHLVDARQAGERCLSAVPGHERGVDLPGNIPGDDPRNRLGHVIPHPRIPAPRRAGTRHQGPQAGSPSVVPPSLVPTAASMARSSRSLALMAGASAATSSERDSSRYTRPETASPTSHE